MSLFTDAMRFGASIFPKSATDYFGLNHEGKIGATCSLASTMVGLGKVDLSKEFDGRVEPSWDGALKLRDGALTIFDELRADFPELGDSLAGQAFTTEVINQHGEHLLHEAGLDGTTNLGQAIAAVNDNTDLSVTQIADLLDNSGVFVVAEAEDTSLFDGTYDSHGY